MSKASLPNDIAQLLANGDIDAAGRRTQAFCLQQPNTPGGLHARGLIALLTGDHQQAAHWLELAEPLAAHDPQLLCNLASAYLKDGRFREAETLLRRWFKDGQELSGGQWQKIALSRAFMRTDADILVLDEPTAAMDAAAEAKIFEHFRKLTQNRIAILISHRFYTVRMANTIIVIENGRVIERGTHEALMQLDGHYAKLFSLQAAGYR